jgi:hypothetical protein
VVGEARETIDAGIEWFESSHGSPAWAGAMVLKALGPVLFGEVPASTIQRRISKANARLRAAGCPYGYKRLQPCDPARVELGPAEVVPVSEADR